MVVCHVIVPHNNHHHPASPHANTHTDIISIHTRTSCLGTYRPHWKSTGAIGSTETLNEREAISLAIPEDFSQAGQGKSGMAWMVVMVVVKARRRRRRSALEGMVVVMMLCD